MLRGFPEVWQVVGKAGRAETPTDPSPLDQANLAFEWSVTRNGALGCSATVSVCAE